MSTIIRVNFNQNEILKDGMYSIRTADLGDQYYLVKTQPSDAYFAAGAKIVYKVEVVKSFHEKVMYEDKGWRLIYNDTHDAAYAVKPFAFAHAGGISVWKRFRNSELPKLIQQEHDTYNYKMKNDPRHAIRHRTNYVRAMAKLGIKISFNSATNAAHNDVALPSKMLWENHADILWNFACIHSKEYGAPKKGVQVVYELEMSGALRNIPEELQ